MKRPLSEEEAVVTNVILNSKQKELGELNENLKYQELAYEFYKRKCEYEDAIRPYNRKLEQDQFNDNIKAVRERIKQTEFSIDSANNQIQNGIDVKEVTELNGNS